MDLDIVNLHQKFSHPYSYRNNDIAHYNFWVTSDPMDVTVRKK